MFPENTKLDIDNMYLGMINDDGTLTKLGKVGDFGPSEIDVKSETTRKMSWIIVATLTAISLLMLFRK